MAYAILRTTKIKSHGDVRGSMEHAERTRETKNADPAKLQDNVTYVKFDAERFYEDVEANRTVKAPVDPNNPTADELRNANVICIEMLLTASPEFFEGKTRKDVLSWAEDNVSFAKNKFGEDNVRSAILHMDEKTPHLTIHVIPLKEHGLTCKSWLGEKSDMRRMQTEYAEAMKPYGLKRGERGSIAEHQTIQEYYSDLEKIKTASLALNPDMKVEVTPDQLRDPSLSDRANIKNYKAEVISDTVAIMQDNIDKLTDKNKKLTAKLLTAENKIDKQTKELTEHRAIATSNREQLEEYRAVKEYLTKPKVAEAIHLEKNPHVAICRSQRAEGISDTDIAYDLLKNHKTPKEKVVEALEYGRFFTDTEEPIKRATERIDAEALHAERAKAAAEQMRVQTEATQREQARIAKRKEYIEKNPHIREYLVLARTGMSDDAIAGRMLQSGFDKLEIATAIATESPRMPKRSDEAKITAKVIVSNASKPKDIAKLSAETYKRLSRILGGDEVNVVAVMLRVNGFNEKTVRNTLTAHSPSVANGTVSVSGIIANALNRPSKDVALLARTADEDLSCLEGEALQEAIKARGDSGVGIE